MKNELRITPIGVGSMLSANSFNTNYLLEKGGTRILVDCGRTAPEALRAVGLSLTDVTNVLVTHAHDDHVGGLGSLAMASRYQAKRKLNLLCSAHFAHVLWHETLRGNLSHNESVGLEHRDLALHDYFNVVSPEVISFEHREVSLLNFGGIRMIFFRTMHAPGTAESWRDSMWSTGLFVDDEVLISGDTRFDPEILHMYGSKARVIFQDTSFSRDPVHAAIEDLRTLPPEIKRKMHLIHYGDNAASQDVSDFAGLAEQGKVYV